MEPKHSVGAYSVYDEVQQSNRSLSDSNGLFRLVDCLSHKGVNRRIERITPASHDLEVYHESVQCVPQLVTGIAGNVAKNGQRI